MVNNSIKGLLLGLIIFLFACSNNKNARLSQADEFQKLTIDATVIPQDQIQKPLVSDIQLPEGKPLGKPIIHRKKNKISNPIVLKNISFKNIGTTNLKPQANNYPTTRPVQSKPILAKLPTPYRASLWKKTNRNILDITKKEGLPLASNNAIFQDEKGSIWGCSRYGGAWQYDGFQFLHFNEYTGLADNSVVDMHFDKDGDVWFGMSTGLAKYDGDHFTHYTGEGEISKNKPTKIIEDSMRNIWVGSQDGLFKLDKKTNTITHFTEDNGLIDTEVNGLLYDKKGQIWVFHNKIGFSIINIEEIGSEEHYKLQHYKTDPSNSLNFYVQCLFENRKGQVFIGSSLGLIELMLDNKNNSQEIIGNQFMSEGANDWVYDITEDHLGQLSVAAGQRLLTLNYTEQNKWVYKGSPIQSNGQFASPLSVTFDTENNLWVGYSNTGIQRINHDQIFEVVSEKFGIAGAINNIIVDRRENIWFLNKGKGLYCLRRPKGEEDEYILQYGKEQGLLANNLIDLAIDRKGDLWMSNGSEISKLSLSNQGDEGVIYHYNILDGITNQKLYDLHVDNENALWIASNSLSLSDKQLLPIGGGLYKLLDNKLYTYGKENGLLSSDTYSVTQDKQGNLWFNSIYYGISKLEPGSKGKPEKWIHFKNNDNNILPNRGMKLHPHPVNGIWISSDENLINIPAETNTPLQNVFLLGKEYDIKFPILTQTVDYNNNVWIAGLSGLNKLEKDPQDSETFFNREVKSFTPLDGLPSNSICLSSAQTSDSLIWIGTEQELLSFHPKELFKRKKEQKVVLNKIYLFDEEMQWQNHTSIQLNNQKIISDFSFDHLSKWNYIPENLSLSYQNNYLGFEFHTNEINHPHNIEYQYMLDGYDTEWNGPTQNSKISYPKLPPGNFTLNVKARINDGEWGDSMEYNFKIKPPWWQTWWAYVLYAIFGSILIYSFYRYRLNINLDKEEAKRLKELDAIKTRLYTNITHEFRTPLTVITGMAAQIKENPKEWFNEGLVMIQRNGNRLLDLVNQMLDLSKLESGKLSLYNKQGDIISFLKYLVESIHSLAKSKNVKIHFLSEEEELNMDFDPEKVQQIMVNLLSNAIKFTPDAGDVYMSLRSISANNNAGSFLQIKVKDTGSGIPDEQIPFIFNRFYQVDDTSTRHGEGTGIGLALVKELVKLMGGDISVKSKVGKGTEFRLLIPISNQASITKLPIPTSKNEVYKENNPYQEQTAVVPNIIDNKKVKIKTQGYGAQPNILLIEDNPDVVAYIASCLQSKYDFQVGKDGQEGVQIALENIPDLIITDVMMPHKDGFEVTEILKKDERTSHIPIIILTAKADIESKLEGLEMGADAFLAKPFHKKELLIRIEQLLKLRLNLQKHYLASVGSNNEREELFRKDNLADQVLPEDQFVLKLKSIVEAQIENVDFNVELFCREIGMSHSQLHRKITALTGLSPNKFIRHIRLNKAKSLLEDPDININTVSYSVGFNDPSYFGRVFKKEFSLTPMEWKEKYNKSE